MTNIEVSCSGVFNENEKAAQSVRAGDIVTLDDGRQGIVMHDASWNEYAAVKVGLNKLPQFLHNPYVSPESELIYDENAPDGYYTILGGVSLFMLAIGFCIGVTVAVILI